MYMLIRMPLACLLIMAYSLWNYRKKKQLPTETAKAFKAMIAVALVHVLAATVTEYTVNRRDQVSEAFNYIWHLIFLISVTTVCVLILNYLLLYIERGLRKPLRRDKQILLMVWILGVAAELVLPIYYIDTVHGSYSLGPKAYALYGVVVYVLVMLVYKSFRYRKIIGKEKSNVLLASVGIFVVTSMIQMRYPYILLTDLAVTLIILGLMENTEDAHMYVSYRTGLYNELGCQEILQELLLREKRFSIGVYAFAGEEAEVEAAMLSVEKQFQEQKRNVICGAVTERLLLVLPLRNMSKMEDFSEGLPGYQEQNGMIRCQNRILACSAEEEIGQILNKAYEFKNRCDEENIQKDELTGLLRRAAAIRQVNYLISSERPFTFIMADLDDFKHMNDTYGHAAGDQLLCQVASIFRKVLRSDDIIGRLGGDEFLIVLSGVTEEIRVREIADRIRSRVKAYGLEQGWHPTVQLSMGARIYLPSEEEISFHQLYAEADNGLYEAKRSGKNRLVFAKSKAENV